ncbi:hypothetical protein Dsin_005606 [Dipteronia sinensis]|uniref:DUF4283 domain-containing protein n=1 Tax=Dipteronia sinensis TaxID=43782 RepID=A0AAE0EF30_9ROSI|nr:hypothetical protein Dsin_005606 [Dipteronia sinensis]
MVYNSMDLMSMEASLYVSSSAGSRVVPSRPHVSLRPHGGKVVDDLLVGSSSMFVKGSLPRGEAVVGGVEPLVGSSLPTSSIRGSSFTDLFKAAPIQVDNVSGPSTLSKKGGYVAIRVDPSAYKSRLEVCKFSLIGRVVLSSGKKPWKLVDLKAKLQYVWKLASVWRLISLGKGYFQIMLNIDAEKNMVWSLGSLNLKPGVLRLQPWIPDFNPSLQKSSNAQVWVCFYDLSWEYWHPKIIFDLARGIGVPLRLDRVTMEGDFRHFTGVLVDIDVSTVPPSSLLLERDDSHSSFILVEYESLPAFCSTCSSIGHFPNACRWNKSSKGIPVNSSKPDSTRDGPVMTVADEGFQDLWALDSVVVHSFAGSDPVLSTVSSVGLVASPGFTFVGGSYYFGGGCSGSTQISGFPASDSQAELRLIAGSSLSSQTEAEGLDASNIS